MLAEVVALRRQGVKLATDALPAPVRGLLHISYRRWRPHYAPNRPFELTVMATVTDAGGDTIHDGMHQVVIRHARLGQLVVAGIETCLERGMEREYPQAWWCTVPMGDVLATQMAAFEAARRTELGLPPGVHTPGCGDFNDP